MRFLSYQMMHRHEWNWEWIGWFERHPFGYASDRKEILWSIFEREKDEENMRARRSGTVLCNIFGWFCLSDWRAQTTYAERIQWAIQGVVDNIAQWIWDNDDHLDEGDDRGLFLSVVAGQQSLDDGFHQMHGKTNRELTCSCSINAWLNICGSFSAITSRDDQTAKILGTPITVCGCSNSCKLSWINFDTNIWPHRKLRKTSGRSRSLWTIYSP